MSKFAKEVGQKEFAGLVSGSRPVLVDFYATWCPPCKAMEPVVERLAERLSGQAEIVKVNIDDAPELAAEYAVRAVPTFVTIVGGTVVHRTAGAMSERDLASMIEGHIAKTA